MRAAWRFRPALWAVLLTAAALAAALALGSWQLQRAEAKRGLLADYLQAATQPAQPLDLLQPAAAAPRPVTVRGHYLAEQQLLQDNQAHQDQPGYHVWTPLRTPQGTVVMVNRGWVPQFARRDQPPALPAPVGETELRGLWRSLPEPGLRMAEKNCVPAERFPAFVVYPTADTLRCLLSLDVADGLLLLDPREPGGYVRDWSFAEAIPPERHVAYAVQWFAIALAILILFLKLNLKKT